MPTNAKYKVYNGSSWVEYHFTTNAAQVSQTTGTGFRKFVSASVKVNGVSFSEDSNNNATVTINASNIDWYGGTKPTTNYLGSAANIQAALVALDTAAKNAYDNVPSGILTTSNYGNTLNSVYQAKDADLTAIAALSGTSGFLKKTAADTWSLDTTTYVPTSRTVNSKALSSNITLYGTDIAMASDNNTTVKDAINAVNQKANGLSASYGISDVVDTSWIYVESGVTSSDAKNAAFNSTNDTVTIEVQAADNDKTHIQVLLSTLGTVTMLKIVLLKDLKVGDSVFVQELNVPDRWLSGRQTVVVSNQVTKYIYTFSKLESYNMTWAAISDKPTTLSGYGITDAKIANGVITLGSNSITPLTSHQTMKYRPIKVNGTQKLGDTSATALDLVAGSNITLSESSGAVTITGVGDTKNTAGSTNNASTKLYLIGATSQAANPQTYSNSGVYIGTNNRLYANEKLLVSCSAGTTAPTNPASGDIWIDTN